MTEREAMEELKKAIYKIDMPVVIVSAHCEVRDKDGNIKIDKQEVSNGDLSNSDT